LGQVDVDVSGNDDRGGRADAPEGPFGEGRRRCGRHAGHRDVPPEVTTGFVVVVVVVGRVVVVVVVADSLLPVEPDVVDVVVEVDDVEELVPLAWAVSEVALTPGCSCDTATPMSAVAPVAARIAVRVKVRTRERARWRFSGVLCSLGCRMGMGLLKCPWLSPRARPSVGRL
jgi:hypothetical protein